MGEKPDTPGPRRGIRPLRAPHNSILTTRQLGDRGFSSKDIEGLVRWNWLIRLHQGVYLVPAPDVLSRAALAAAGEGAVLCLESALAHLDLRLRTPGPVRVNVASAGGRANRGERVKVHRAKIPEADVDEVRGLPTTTPTRTLLDVAPRQPRHGLLRALEQAERLRVHLDSSRLSSCRQLAQPLELLAHYGPCTRSDVEAMFLFLCEDHRIRRPLVNQLVSGRETDFHWPDAHLVAEVDGYEFHAARRAFHADRERGVLFRRDGFEVIRFSAWQVEHRPRLVAETLLRARRRLSRSAS